jgi:Uma2 family endonuclease
MTAEPVLRLSYAEYLALEAASERKHEYLRGEAWAMAGGTIEHGRLQANVVRELGNALSGKPCVVLSSDVKVRVDETDRTTYPDASVVCGPRQTSPLDRHAIVNPVVIVEVLSEGTERDDRGEKFAHYRRLPSLMEYVLVSQEARRIEVFRRTPEGWMLVEAGPGQHLELRSLGVSLDVDAVYFDPAA